MCLSEVGNSYMSGKGPAVQMQFTVGNPEFESQVYRSLCETENS